MRRFFWQWPEWWVAFFCAFGWYAMAVHSLRFSSHGVHHRMSFFGELQYWVLMVLAMMLPFTRNSVRTVAFASLWPRRHRAIAFFLFGFLLPWTFLGVAAALLRGQSWSRNSAAPALMFFLASLWQFTPFQKRALVDCHRTAALAPLGWRADQDCLCFGARIGIACVANCWPLMLACALTGHGAVAMVGGMGLGLAERLPFRPASRWVIFGCLALASYYLLLAVWPNM